MAISEFRHMNTSFFFSIRLFKSLQDSLWSIERMFSVIPADKTTMDSHCIFMTMSQPPTADYIARSSIIYASSPIHIDLYQLTPQKFTTLTNLLTGH